MTTKNLVFEDKTMNAKQGICESPRTKGYMVKCRVCKNSRRINVPLTHKMIYPKNGPAWMKRMGWVELPNSFRQTMADNPCPCNPRDGFQTVRPIKGHYNPDVKCGDKCRSAIGPSCECSCRGKNHGGGR